MKKRDKPWVAEGISRWKWYDRGSRIGGHSDPRPFEERFESYISPEPNSGCWLWTGGVTGSGYGGFWLQNKNELAHRISYQIHRGPIPEELELDHLCRNRICCNPDHLEPVNHLENMARGVGFIAENIAKTHCLRGHEFTTENTYLHINSRGIERRHCRQCRSRWYRKHVLGERWI